MTPTPGYKTTEFALTMLVHLLTVLVQANVLAADSPWAKIASLVLSALAQFGYTVSRGSVKSAEATAAGAIEVAKLHAPAAIILAPPVAPDNKTT